MAPTSPLVVSSSLAQVLVWRPMLLASHWRSSRLRWRGVSRGSTLVSSTASPNDTNSQVFVVSTEDSRQWSCLQFLILEHLSPHIRWQRIISQSYLLLEKLPHLV